MGLGRLAFGRPIFWGAVTWLGLEFGVGGEGLDGEAGTELFGHDAGSFGLNLSLFFLFLCCLQRCVSVLVWKFGNCGAGS